MMRTDKGPSLHAAVFDKVRLWRDCILQDSEVRREFGASTLFLRHIAEAT